MIVALIPAHNESAGIVATIDSLKNQTVRPDHIIVVADNCTDDTVALSEQAGAIVFNTLDNSDKKAGALNQAIEFVLPHLSDEDVIVAMDADSLLCEDWVETASSMYEPHMGALSGAYVARKGRGAISLLQRAEYAQERRRISRRHGRVDVLSGTAVWMPVSTLNALMRSRGYVYDVDSLTEDFEVTLAIKELGLEPRCFKELKVITDVMETWKELYRQRLRWQRGTIETLRSHGFTDLTKFLWITQFLTYASSLVPILVIISWIATFQMGGAFSFVWLLILPVFIAEQVVSSWKGGIGARIIAGILIPMWFYDIFRLSVYWIALWKSVVKTESTWH